jgi:hypothetical protein
MALSNRVRQSTRPCACRMHPIPPRPRRSCVQDTRGRAARFGDAKQKRAPREPDQETAVAKRLGDIGTEGVGSSPAELDEEQFTLNRQIARDNPALLSGQ